MATHRRVSGLASLLLLLPLAGCSEFLVRRTEGPCPLSDLLTRGEPTADFAPESVRTLRQHELIDVYRRSPAEALQRLQQLTADDPSPELLLTLAEVCRVLARRAEKEHSDEAQRYHYLCAGYAYARLVQKAKGNKGEVGEFWPDESRPQDLYNAGVAGWLRATGYAGSAEPKVPAPALDPPPVRHGFAWRPEEFGALLFCAEHQASRQRQRPEGVGVPLIVLHDAANAPGHDSRLLRYPRGLCFPATAFLRFEGGVAELASGKGGQLELYNPLLARTVTMGDRCLPLLVDLNTPLAYFRKHHDLQGVGDLGFLSPDKLRERAGIYAFEPYQPGKVPLLLVHGLRSSPATWLTLLQELRADPQVRERYQFWFVLYPTGDQYLKAAADLRLALARLREQLDPRRRDAALDDMVVVGHSLGGLVARMLVVDGSDDFWKVICSRPLEDLRTTAETETELKRIFCFEREPCIRRAVFIGTPHRGCKLSASLPVRLATQFSHPPRVLTEAARDLVRANPGLDASSIQRLVPGSEMMAPGSPFLEVLVAQPKPRGVAYHSIIGVAPLHETVLERTVAVSFECKSDGVVTQASAHLGTADSEVVVPADHTQVKHHPQTVAELRRILLEHVKVAVSTPRPADSGDSATAP